MDKSTMEVASYPGGVEILPFASCYRNRDKRRPDGPLGLCAAIPGSQWLGTSEVKRAKKKKKKKTRED